MDKSDHKYFIKSPQNMEAMGRGGKEMESAVFTSPRTFLWKAGGTN